MKYEPLKSRVRVRGPLVTYIVIALIALAALAGLAAIVASNESVARWVEAGMPF